MKRGDLVSVAAPGDYGKSRPAVVVQSDHLTATVIGSVIVCLLTTHPARVPAMRIPLKPSAANGLKQASVIMVDKLPTVPRERIGEVIGRITDEEVVRLNRALAFVVGLGE